MRIALRAALLLAVSFPAMAHAGGYNPFQIDTKNPPSTSINGTPDQTGAYTDINNAMKRQGLVDMNSIQKITGTTANTGILKDVGITQAQIDAAKAGQVDSWKDPATQKMLMDSFKAAGVTEKIINVRKNLSVNETINKPGSPAKPAQANNVTVSRVGIEKAGVPPALINAWMATNSIINLTGKIGTKISVARTATIPGQTNGGLHATFPCAVDVLLKTDTCCAMATKNVQFYLSSITGGIGNNLDVPGTGDATLYDRFGKSTALQIDVDALSRLLLCTNISAMDDVNAGTGVVVGEGVIQ